MKINLKQTLFLVFAGIQVDDQLSDFMLVHYMLSGHSSKFSQVLLCL